MKIKSLTIFMACLLLSCFAVPVLTACCPPPRPPCRRCEDGVWVWKCGAGQTCCSGSCCSGSCCDNKTCYDPDTKRCCHYGTGQTCDKNKQCCDGDCCDPDKCESCVDGECKVCGGDPNYFCCDGSCCDKVWTKETINSDTEPCSDCEYSLGEPMCDGTTTEMGSYEKCLNVGVGQGEHCQCNQEWQVVGYKYPCQINWDVSKLVWCAAQCVCCAVECALSGFDPATCGNCLAGVDCCGGPCGICDFVETCEKNPFIQFEQEKYVFSSFDC